MLRHGTPSLSKNNFSSNEIFFSQQKKNWWTMNTTQLRAIYHFINVIHAISRSSLMSRDTLSRVRLMWKLLMIPQILHPLINAVAHSRVIFYDFYHTFGATYCRMNYPTQQKLDHPTNLISLSDYLWLAFICHRPTSNLNFNYRLARHAMWKLIKTDQNAYGRRVDRHSLKVIMKITRVLWHSLVLDNAFLE